MDDEQLADLHRFLAEYHRKLAKEAVLDVVQQYHSDLRSAMAQGVAASDHAQFCPNVASLTDLRAWQDRRT